jgi:hypothetical protein
MNSKKWLIPLAIIGLIGVIAVGWYFGSPLFINQTVDEAFPFELPSEAQLDQMSEDEKMAMEAEFLAAVPDDSVLEAMSDTDKTEVETSVLAAAAVMPDHEMEDPMPEADANSGNDPMLVIQGSFQDADNFHQGSGQAGIYELPDGSHVLRFEDFMVTNGPDLHVLLASGENPTERGNLGEYIDLGKLKGNLGNQNYEIPTGTDLSEYNSIVIYCQPFRVVFSVASIHP